MLLGAATVQAVSTSGRPRRIEVNHPPRYWYRFRTVDGQRFDVHAAADDERTFDYVTAQLRAWGINSPICAVVMIDQPEPLPAEMPGSLTLDEALAKEIET